MRKKVKKIVSDWDELSALIGIYGDHSRQDEMKGGGDPRNYHEIELNLALAREKLHNHICRMREKYEG